jgi:hypothetical protein
VFYRRIWNIVGKYSILCCDKMEEFMDDEMESEILQMFSCGCVDKIKMEPRANKNQ